jgi:hypothetical protein
MKCHAAPLRKIVALAEIYGEDALARVTVHVITRARRNLATSSVTVTVAQPTKMGNDFGWRRTQLGSNQGW